MREESTPGRGTRLYRDRTHVPVIGIVSIRMMQADIDAEINLVVLRVPPTGVDDLVFVYFFSLFLFSLFLRFFFS
jgi:hypothetical protein